MKKKKEAKIGVGYVVKANIRDIEDNTNKGRSRRMRKEVVGCVHDVVWKEKFLV